MITRKRVERVIDQVIASTMGNYVCTKIPIASSSSLMLPTVANSYAKSEAGRMIVDA
jgi:hypothetical protein